MCAVWIVLSINGKESPLYLRVATNEVFLGDYSTLKNDHMTLMYAMWPVNVKKNISIEVVRNIPLSNYLKKHDVSVIYFFAIYGHFYEIDVFPLGAFSIRNFNLHNLKANELANELLKHCLFVLYFFFKQMHSTNLFLIKDEQAQKSIIFPTVLTLLSYVSLPLHTAQIQSILIYKSPSR